MVVELPVLAAFHLPYLLLLLSRTSGFFLTVPFFSAPGAPVAMRGGLALAVALILYPRYGAQAEIASGYALAWLTAMEVVTGIFLGGLVRVLFAALQLAGQLAGFGIGLSLARVIDPGAATEDSLGPTLFQYVGLMLFIGVGGHRELLAAIIESYRYLPLGQASVDANVVSQVVTLVSQMFQVGLRLAAPVSAVLFLVDILLALGNRVVPQIPILLVGMPVKTWFGIVVLGWGLSAYAGPSLAWLSRAPELLTGFSRILATP